MKDKKMPVYSIGNPIGKDERGVTAIVVAVVLFLLFGFAALAIDVAHLYGARAELQNAADAGALAGARILYSDLARTPNELANQEAYDAATANKSERVPVDVNWTGGNEGDVQRGHWSFGLGGMTRGFYPNDSLEPPNLWDRSAEDLDADPKFINAIRVVTRRQATPVESFFARIFGRDSFQLSAEAVAYIGFAGTLLPGDLHQPIAICADSIMDAEGNYTCSVGRMINSGQNEANRETGAWTSFSQDDPCTGGTNAQEVKDLVCGAGNPEEIQFGGDMATNGGEIQSAFNKLIECWANATGRTKSWNVTLPVISCPGNTVGTCEQMRGAVNVNIVWITGAGEDPNYRNAPKQMAGVGEFGDWSDSNPDGEARWNSFAANFQIKDIGDDNQYAPYKKKSIYFLPDCTPHEPDGVSGGDAFGVLARIPVLVK